MDWDRWPNFSRRELECKHTGECLMDPAFMDALQELRTRLGEPLVITSGYRSPRHPIEKAKATPGVHAMGLAVDIASNGQKAHRILREAFAMNFTGIGVARSFIHLDMWFDGPRPNVWVY